MRKRGGERVGSDGRRREERERERERERVGSDGRRREEREREREIIENRMRQKD